MPAQASAAALDLLLTALDFPLDRGGVLRGCGQGGHHGRACPDRQRGALSQQPVAQRRVLGRDREVGGPGLTKSLACLVRGSRLLQARGRAHDAPPPRCRYWTALGKCAAASDRQLVGFERYMALRKSGGNHCHINALAVTAEAAGRARQVCRSGQHGDGDALHRVADLGGRCRPSVRLVLCQMQGSLHATRTSGSLLRQANALSPGPPPTAFPGL